MAILGRAERVGEFLAWLVGISASQPSTCRNAGSICIYMYT